MITSSALDGGRKRSSSDTGLATTPTSLSDAVDVPFKTAKKRRKTMARVTVTVRLSSAGEAPFDDGYSWRKYGQKEILGAKYPRGYYMCLHRHSQKCKATKQVQRNDDDTRAFDVIYCGEHTCVQMAALGLPPPDTENVTPPMPLDPSSPWTRPGTSPSPVRFLPMRYMGLKNHMTSDDFLDCLPWKPAEYDPALTFFDGTNVRHAVTSLCNFTNNMGMDQPFHNLLETTTHARAPDHQAPESMALSHVLSHLDPIRQQLVDDYLSWGADHRIHNFLEEDTPSPAQPTGCSKMPQQSNTSPLELPPPATQHVTPPSTNEPGACSAPQAPKHMGLNTDLTLQEDLDAHEILEMTVAQSHSKPAGIGASAYSGPTVEDAEDSHVHARGVDQTFHIFLDTPTHAQAVSNGSSSQSINVGDGTNARDCVRTKKRLSWTKEEDLILVSAWLSHSNDPNKLNYKKNEQFWEAVTAVYNNKIRKERSRKVKQVKDHFEKIKKALKTYEEEHKNDGLFMFEHCWEDLRKEPKWDDYLKRLRDEPQIGGKQAKKQEKRERKEQASVIDLEDEHDKVVDAQNTANEGHREMLEIQRHVPSENLEARMIARDKDTPETQMNAAKEQNELLKMYYSLTIKDTTGMSKDEKSEHVLALKFFREKLSGKPE
ncbi:hypothetical protein ACP70R_045594 [Stipagrostis hirtigluma subsp. patula]